MWETHSPGKSPSSSSWPDLVSITEDSPFPLLFVTAVCGNKGKIGSLYKTWQTRGCQSETLVPCRPWVHTHRHIASDQTPTLSFGTEFYWAGPPTLDAVSVKTYIRLAWHKRGQTSYAYEHLHLYANRCGERLRRTKTWGIHGGAHAQQWIQLQTKSFIDYIFNEDVSPYLFSTDLGIV